MVEDMETTVAIACQGGGSHTAFTAGVLRAILQELPDEYEIGALSGTSGGAMCAALAWDGLRRGDTQGAIDRLEAFWNDIAAETPWDRFVNNAALLGSRLTAEFGSFGVSPYRHSGSVSAQRELRETVERHVQFDDDVPSSPPHLFVGAVDVESGSFQVFANGEQNSAALLASAAIPNFFRAVEINGAGHWDGLFSQNPPIRHFVSEVDPEEKPDEIWIVRINPVATSETPHSLADIADRRNELAGNLSLEQEKHMIEAINDLIDEGVIDDERYKPIELREIDLDMELDLESKLDRSPDFLEDLMERGEAKASAFWTATETASRANGHGGS
ncbi:NTE family protein [Halogranum amylolyticum]|uniref:NTE family protein n=1 Tax=Halogranum amylolyticum TaxID=660520 RepID=A0A1H8V3Y7_9EURY|nr:patatin-like phospholipase family protein [Halogranum amylolyticum]SEP10106.1 NTE family protein [Halogranum amylolyticum]